MQRVRELQGEMLARDHGERMVALVLDCMCMNDLDVRCPPRGMGRSGHTLDSLKLALPSMHRSFVLR